MHGKNVGDGPRNHHVEAVDHQDGRGLARPRARELAPPSRGARARSDGGSVGSAGWARLGLWVDPRPIRLWLGRCRGIEEKQAST